MICYWISIAASLVAVAGCLYLVAAAIMVRRFARDRAPAVPAAPPSVTVLKPLEGDEPGLVENLASFCRQDYDGPVQYVFGVQDPRNSAIAAVKLLRRIEPECDIDLVVETRLHGLNRKVSNLVNLEERIRHDVVVLADSDMRVETDYLSRLAEALQEPGVGAVTCLYYGRPATGIWSELSALAINAHFLPSIVVNMALDWTRACFGSTIALRRETLAEIGGFRTVANELADDYALGQAIRAQGHRIAVPPFAVAHMCTTKDAAELWRQEQRGARTVRSIDPAGYAGTIVTHPLPWALIALAAAVLSGAETLLPELGLVIAAMLGRVALLRQMEHAFRLPPQAYWLTPVRDLFSFAVFVSSFMGRDVNWRGRSYHATPVGGWAGGVRSP